MKAAGGGGIFLSRPVAGVRSWRAAGKDEAAKVEGCTGTVGGEREREGGGRERARGSRNSRSRTDEHTLIRLIVYLI